MKEFLSFGVGFWIVFGAGAAIGVLLAHLRQVLDWLEYRLEGPPQRHQQRAQGHCRVVSAPSPLPRRDQGDCSLYNWEGGDDAA